jgi:YgiT-type zinc finger domain-containing protein
MIRKITDVPFKTNDSTIIIVKQVPIFQCTICSEYSLEDTAMEKVDEILFSVDEDAELEIRKFAM